MLFDGLICTVLAVAADLVFRPGHAGDLLRIYQELNRRDAAGP